VRAQVRRILVEARKRGQTRSEDQTLREWATAKHRDRVSDQSLSLYESVRYGNQPDTREAAEQLKSQWPAWPEDDNASSPLGARLGRRRRANPRINT
jgi:hypothetical protein